MGGQAQGGNRARGSGSAQGRTVPGAGQYTKRAKLVQEPWQ